MLVRLETETSRPRPQPCPEVLLRDVAMENKFGTAICYNCLSMGYKFGCVIASCTIFDSTGGFLGSCCPMKI